MLTKHYSLETKSIKDWLLEIRTMSHRSREKYERCFLGKKASIGVMHFWRNTSETYMSLNEILYHLVNYGSHINEDKCLSCKYEPVHRANLAKNFKRWRPWIIRCTDGERFKENNPSIYEIMTRPSSHDVPLGRRVGNHVYEQMIQL
jgi:hypothetical protein